MDIFLIDRKIISMFLKIPEEGEQMDAFLDEYAKKQAAIFKKVAFDFYRLENDLSKLDFDSNMEIAEELGIEETEFANDEEFVSKYTDELNKYNKKLYLHFSENLTEEEKETLNNHIEQVSDEMLEGVRGSLEEIEQVLQEELDALEAATSSQNEPNLENNAASAETPEVVNTEGAASTVDAAKIELPPIE